MQILDILILYSVFLHAILAMLAHHLVIEPGTGPSFVFFIWFFQMFACDSWSMLVGWSLLLFLGRWRCKELCLPNDTLMTLLNDLPRMAVEWLLWRLPCEQKPPILSTSQTPIFWTPGSCCNSCAASSVFNLAMIYDMQLGGWQGPIKSDKDWLLSQERQRGNPRQCIYIYIRAP